MKLKLIYRVLGVFFFSWFFFASASVNTAHAQNYTVKTSMRIDPLPTVDGKVVSEAGLSCTLTMNTTYRVGIFSGQKTESKNYVFKDIYPASKFQGGKSVPISVTIDTTKKMPSGRPAGSMFVYCSAVVNTVSGGSLLGSTANNDRYFDMSKSHLPTYSKKIK